MSYTTFNQKGNIYIQDGILYLPSAQKSSVKVVGLQLHLHRPLPQESEIKHVTVSMNTKGQFDVSICVAFPMEITNMGKPTRILGLDYSQSHFFVDHEGKKANLPKILSRNGIMSSERTTCVITQSKRLEALGQTTTCHCQTTNESRQPTKRLASQESLCPCEPV